MVQHLILEALSPEANDREHWRGLARSLARELEHYFKSSKLNGGLASRYRLQYIAARKHATKVENALSEYLKNCNVCKGDDTARWNCPACSDYWELITNAENTFNVIDINDMLDRKD